MWLKKNNWINLFILTVLFVGNYQLSMSQDKYISFKEFESAFNQNADLSALSRRFDLLHILLLNPSEKQTFFRYDRELEELFNEYFPAMKLSNKTVGFTTQKTSVEQVLETDMGKILLCLFDEPPTGIRHMINYPIYVKDDCKAIVEMSLGNASDIFYVKLANGVVQINWLGGTME